MSFSSGKEDDPYLTRSNVFFEQEPVFDEAARTKGVEKKSGPPAVPITPTAPSVAPSTPAPLQRTMLQIAAPSTVVAGQQFTVEVKVSAVNDLVNAPFVLSYNPVSVEFVSMMEGPFLKGDGKPTTFSSKADAVGGAVSVSLSRTSGSGGVSGGGSLATATFRAKKAAAGFAFKSVGFSGVNGAAINVLPFSTEVQIR
jgi:general secretion pathway protein D